MSTDLVDLAQAEPRSFASTVTRNKRKKRETIHALGEQQAKRSELLAQSFGR
jgi:hypothetical protein